LEKGNEKYVIEMFAMVKKDMNKIVFEIKKNTTDKKIIKLAESIPNMLNNPKYMQQVIKKQVK
jgi:hypothetical protein